MLRSTSQFLAAGVAICIAGPRWQQPRSLSLSCETFPTTASLSALRTALGGAEISADSVPLGPTEGQMLPATVFFPRDPARRIVVVWKDTVAQVRPRFVYLAGGRTEWRTADGITIGTSLHELERLNHQAFRLAGFAFDAAGAVVSWNGGRLATPLGSRCQRRVYVDSISATGLRSAAFRALRGDAEFSSTNRDMQKLNPRVSTILLEYP
jgi:hypothetical protein